MDDLETGKDKIKRICEILKNESLEPAKKEAEKTLEEAGAQAHEIIREAEKKALAILDEARKKMEKERQIFEHSLAQSCKQSLESLRQQIEERLFNKELATLVEKGAQEEKMIADLLTALIHAIEKEGTSADFSALIPKILPVEKVNKWLASDVVKKLREKSVVLGDFEGGVQIKMHDKNLLLDMSDSALKELLGKYLRKDFRTLLFAT